MVLYEEYEEAKDKLIEAYIKFEVMFKWIQWRFISSSRNMTDTIFEDLCKALVSRRSEIDISEGIIDAETSSIAFQRSFKLINFRSLQQNFLLMMAHKISIGLKSMPYYPFPLLEPEYP